MVTKAPLRRKTRDADATRDRILKSVAAIILRDGLASVGVNALAREAGCDKVLIYRYFGDLDGVYDAFAKNSDFWWTLAELVEGINPEHMSLQAAAKLMLRRNAEAIRSRPLTLAVLAAEPNARTPLVIALENVREARALELVRWIGQHYTLPPDFDFATLSLLLGVAATYLAIRARKIRVMSGIGIRTDEDWNRIYAALDLLIDGAFLIG
jgi:AcrR family transcriptional regulator